MSHSKTAAMLLATTILTASFPSGLGAQAQKPTEEQAKKQLRGVVPGRSAQARPEVIEPRQPVEVSPQTAQPIRRDTVPVRAGPPPLVAPDPSYYVSHSPHDLSVITTPSTTLSFMRTDDGQPASGPDCTNASGPAYAAIVEVVETGNALTEADATAPTNVVYSKAIKVPFGCTVTLDPETFRFDKYKAYAWSVYDPGRRERATWQRMVFSDFATAIQTDGSPTGSQCLRTSVLRDGSFIDRKGRFWLAGGFGGRWQLGASMPGQGYEDAGFMKLGGNRNAVALDARARIAAKKRYQFSAAVRIADGRRPVEVKAYALKQPAAAGGANPTAGATLIGKTVPIKPVAGQWTTIAFDPWIAGDNYQQVVIEVVYPKGGGPAADIDNVCMTPTRPTQCVNPVEGPRLPSGGGSAPATDDDLIRLGAVSSEEEVDMGPVSEVFGAYDTTTADWYDLAAGEGLMNCLSIGEGDENAVEPLDEDDDDALAEAESQWASIENSVERIDLAPHMPDITGANERRRDPVEPPVPTSCSMEQTLDPSLPFGGRHVVYVHGLVTDHLNDNYMPNPSYQQKWPQDPDAFEWEGVFRNGAAKYWDDHIKQGLGDLDQPSNSYLVVGYSTNQRLSTSIHAVLTQIRNAMSARVGKPHTVASAKDAKFNQCFGANGIVLVSHSTGALLTSSMLGIATRTQSEANTAEVWGDLSFLNNAAKVHVSFNGALKGSPIATVGAGAMELVNPVALELLRELTGIEANGTVTGTQFYETVLIDLMPPVASSYWTQIYNDAKVPTLTIGGDMPGTSKRVSTLFGQLLIRGMDDGVVSASSQFARTPELAAFNVKSPLLMYDLGRHPLKALTMVRQSKNGQSVSRRNYLAIPHLSPSGMVQSSSVASVVNAPGNTANNHFPIMQVASDHYGLTRPGRDGSGPKTYPSGRLGIPNYEESTVVVDPEVYSQQLVNSSFATLNHQYRRKKSIGFHYPSAIRISKWFNIKIEWSYFEKILWQRYYHLAKDHEDKNAIDYVYEHVAR